MSDAEAGAMVAQRVVEAERDENLAAGGSAPVFFANGVQFKVNYYDFRLEFTLRPAQEQPAVVVASVHMSPQLAKVMGRLLGRSVLAYEEQTGAPISIPQALADELQIGDLQES